MHNSIADLTPKPAKRPRTVFKFGHFELRTESGELAKHGVRVKLQAKPLQILEALLEKPGELVTREELCAKLWPCGTFVDFENGLNTAANRLRTALGDSAEAARYVETVPRRGYRLICPVTRVEPPIDASFGKEHLRLVEKIPPRPTMSKIRKVVQSFLNDCTTLWRRTRR